MKKHLMVLGFVAAFAPAAFAQDASTVTTAAQFVPMAAVSDLFEIQSGQLAEKKAQSEHVKTAAAKIVADHTKSSKELEAAAKKAGIAFQKPDKLDAKHQQMLDELTKADGKSFDQTFDMEQLQAHQEAVAMFTAYSTKGDQADVKAFATKTLPVLQEHLKMFMEMKQ